MDLVVGAMGNLAVDLVAGAMGSLGPKLLQLLQDEYKLHKDVKAQVRSLAGELKSIHVALCKVAQVPYDQLDLQVKLWASEAREASYEMEDILDNFLVRDDGGNQKVDADKAILSRFLEKISNLLFNLSKIKASREIATTIEDIKKRVDEIATRCERYKVDHVVANSATTSIDPRIMMTLRTKASDLVGIDESRDALINMLSNEKAALLPHRFKKRKIMNKEMKIISIVGSRGLGKTTLAKVVYEKLTVDMKIYCKAFVLVGRNPDLKEVFRDILLGLDKGQYMNKINFMILDETRLIEEIRAFLKEKRYFIVIDDVWEVPTWKAIRIVHEDNNFGSKVMTTTRSSDVAELAHCTYKIQPLHPDSSKILFYGRIFRSQDWCPETFLEISDKILKKCDGVPLAIITIASLLANKPDDITEWNEVCSSIGSGLSCSNDMYNDMRKILSLSYYDLPSHMKTCFLYLSMYPEDYYINRDRLIWRWISEGFIRPQKKGEDLFELGESYFNDLINRSLVQPVVGAYYWTTIVGCRVHDLVLDLICSLSREENFVTMSDDIEQVMSSENKKLRRLSVKSTAMWPKKGVSKVRSIALFQPRIDSTPSFSCLDMLRVLDLEGCSLKDCYGKLSVGNLIHLRYLGLRNTGLKVFPAGIENLQFLHVLNMHPFGDCIDLPDPIFGLRRLMCLEGVHCCPRRGNLLRNLASLQVLDALFLDEDTAGIVEALGHLTRLVKLTVRHKKSLDQSICDTFIGSLGNLSRLQTLVYSDDTNSTNMSWERFAPPPHLHVLRRIFSPTLPKWISRASLPHLAVLRIEVHTGGHENIQILGMLPNLTVLWLIGNRMNYLEQPLQKFVVSADAFPRLRVCAFRYYVAALPSMCPRGAMPRVEHFEFYIRARDFFSNHAQGGLDFDDLAMDHLPLLQYVSCTTIEGETDVTEEEAAKLEEAVKHAAAVHPTHPELVLF